MSDKYRINPPSDDLKSHFTMIPNVVMEMGLDPLSFRLYIHILYIGAQCWASTRTLATACQMSIGAIVKAKRVLADKGLIAITALKDDKQQAYHDIRPADIWEMNRAHQAAKRAKKQGGGVHHVNGGCSPHEHGCSPHELNNTPYNKTRDSRPDQNPTPKTDPANAVSAPPANAGGGTAGRKRHAKKDSEGQTGATEKPFTPSQSEGEAPPPQDVPPAPPAPRKNRTPRPADPVIEAVREGSFKGAAVTSRIAGVGQYLLKAVYGDGATLEQGQALAAELKGMYKWYPQATKGLTPPTAGDKVYSWLRTYQAANGAVKPPKPPCAVCAGKGWVWVNYQARTTDTCPDCGGNHDE